MLVEKTAPVARPGTHAPDHGRRVAILVATADLRHGGAPLRWNALQRALGEHLPCVLYRTACQPCGRCEPCRTIDRSEAGVPNWHFSRAYCARRADELAADLAATGVAAVVCSGLETTGYVAHLAAAGTFSVIHDMHNVEYPLNRDIRAAAMAEPDFADFYTEQHLRTVLDAERAAVTAADEVWVCSRADLVLATTTYPDVPPEKIRVVPNAVAVHGPPDSSVVPRRICFTGRMGYYPNLLAARTMVRAVAPLIAGLGHDIQVVVAGRSVRDAFATENVAGNVRLVSDPPDTVDIIAGGIMAVPLTLGGGTRLKILEAFALGAPVVSTGKGVEGLDVVAGCHYLPASSPADFASGIDELIRRPTSRARLVGPAWRLVRDRYSVPALAAGLADFASALGVGRRSR